MAVVEFENVDVLFGREKQRALELLDGGTDRDAVQSETGVVVAVRDASLSIERGELCVIMGLSGSGKSTLLRCVNGLNRATRGRVRVEDGDRQVDVTRCDPGTLRRLRMQRIAMVFQQFALLPWRTVRENVGFGLELRGLPREEREAIVDDKLELVGLDRWGDKFAHELSGGMQQRVGLARAFATDAEILLMDEPFSALDPLIRTHLQDELLELQRRLKKTIIFVSHDLDEALKLGTHIAIMEGGRIVQYGEPEAIVLEPANRYVADFVAHMNPLNVLTGAALMTPLESLENSDGAVALDREGAQRLALDPDGRARSLRSGERPVPLRTLDEDGDGDDPCAFVAPPAATMRSIIEARQRSGYPVILVEDGKVVGVVGDREIYRGLLHQSESAARDPEP